MNRNTGTQYDSKDKIRASPTKIAYYVQNMAEKNIEPGKIILMLTSRFDRRDIRHFAMKYKYCFNEDHVRKVANLIYAMPGKVLDKSMERLLDRMS